MSKVKRYAYLFILAVTIFVMTPYMVKEVWSTHKVEPDVQDAGMIDVTEKIEEKYTKPLASVEKQMDRTTLPAQEAELDVAEEEEISKEAVAPQKPKFVKSDASYFDNALFIGDSRTVGICEYGGLKNADYYADTGMSVLDLYKKTAAIPGGVNFETMLSQKEYGKVYIMLGINEVGNDQNRTAEKYAQLISYIQERQPEALIYIQANLHVSAGRSQKDSVVNNGAIDTLNARLEALADDETVFYIDVNEIFDDEAGNLKAECTSDNTHVFAKYYQDWTNWLCTKTIAE